MLSAPLGAGGRLRPQHFFKNDSAVGSGLRPDGGSPGNFENYKHRVPTVLEYTPASGRKPYDYWNRCSRQ
jgi:hypothetical protein